MANTSGKQLSVGVRRAVVFELDPTTGLPIPIDEVAYEGFEVIGPKAFTLTIADSRKISHVGNDRVLAIDYLPPTEGDSGELRIASSDTELKAILTGVNEFQIGEATSMAWGTDNRGFETDAGLLLFQQSLDASTRLRRWRFYIIPKARIIPAPASMDENASEDRFIVGPNPTTTHLWGAPFTAITEGALEASIIEGMSQGRPNIIAFRGDAVVDDFLFPVGKPPISVDKVVVWVNGVEQTSGITVSLTQVTFTVAPALDAIIVVFYEY